jgi:hypothetical protein
LIFPQEAFDKLRPYREELLAMSQTYRAGGPEYMALSRAVSLWMKLQGSSKANRAFSSRPGSRHNLKTHDLRNTLKQGRVPR